MEQIQPLPEEPASPPVEAAAEALWIFRPMSREYDGEAKPWPTLKRYQRERYRGMAAAALKAAFPSSTEAEELTQIQLLAAIGVLAVLAHEEKGDALRLAQVTGNPDEATTAHHAEKWLREKLGHLDVSALPKGALALHECKHCGRPIFQRRKDNRWAHESTPSTHGPYRACLDQSGRPPLRVAEPRTEDAH